MTRLEIEAFLSVIKYGSISAAAEHLYVTQPALSRRIYALEQELGYTLLHRAKGVRSITLTAEGAAFVPVAEKWNYVYQEARAISNRNQKPILNLSSIGSISTYLLPPILRQIIAEDNSYNLCFHNYHSYESYGYVESGIIDLALISDAMYHKTVLTTPAFQEPFVLVGGPAWENIDTVHPSQLNPRCEIRLPWNPAFDAWHALWFDAALYPRVQLDQMSLLEEFLTGNNFAVVPLIVARSLHHGRMHICRLIDGPKDEIIYYLTRSSRSPDNSAMLPSSSVSQPAQKPWLTNNPAGMIQHFLQLLQNELKNWEGVRSFLEEEKAAIPVLKNKII